MPLRPPEGIESLVGVPDERKTHLGSNIFSCLRGLSTKNGAVVILVDLVDREVLRINIRLQLGLERSTDTAQTVPLNSAEEGVLLDLIGTADAAKTVLSIADEA